MSKLLNCIEARPALRFNSPNDLNFPSPLFAGKPSDLECR